MAFSSGTLTLFAQILNAQTIPATHPQAVEMAATFARARSELEEALAEQVSVEEAELPAKGDAT